MQPVADRLAAGIDDGRGPVHAEALSFRLAATMPRTEAQAAVKRRCKGVLATGTPLAELAARGFPQADLSGVFDPAAQFGLAPQEARSFAARAAALAKGPDRAKPGR